jgi:hypothetical protein
LGEKKTKNEKKIKNAIKPNVSLMKKYGKKLILSEIDEIPIGLFDPSKCTAAK